MSRKKHGHPHHDRISDKIKKLVVDIDSLLWLLKDNIIMLSGSRRFISGTQYAPIADRFDKLHKPLNKILEELKRYVFSGTQNDNFLEETVDTYQDVLAVLSSATDRRFLRDSEAKHIYSRTDNFRSMLLKCFSQTVLIWLEDEVSKNSEATDALDDLLQSISKANV